MSYGEALKAVMKQFNISISNLEEMSLKDYRTIVAYRNGEYLPSKSSAVQLDIGLKAFVPMDILLILIENAGFNLYNAHEDIVYMMLLFNISDIETANLIIDDINKSELYNVNKVERFKTISN